MRPLARRPAWLARPRPRRGAPRCARRTTWGPRVASTATSSARKAWQDSHAQTLAQLAEPKAAEYAKATGGNAKHPKCLACHAPVPLAAGPAAVSCESCHGPAKGWLAPHQELGLLQPARRAVDGPAQPPQEPDARSRGCAWTATSSNDKAIAAAGHPVGARRSTPGARWPARRWSHWPSGTVNDTRVRGYDERVLRRGLPRRRAHGGRALRGHGGQGGRGREAGGATAPPRGARGVPAWPPAKPAAPPADDEYADLGDDEFVADRGAGGAAPAPARRRRRSPGRSSAWPWPIRPPPRSSAAGAHRPAAIAAAAAAARRPRRRRDPAPRRRRRGAAAPAGRARAARSREVRGRAALVLADLIRQKKKLDLPAARAARGVRGPGRRAAAPAGRSAGPRPRDPAEEPLMDHEQRRRSSAAATRSAGGS